MITIRAGSTLSGSSGTVVKVVKTVTHPQFSSRDHNNDIAILTLERDLVYGPGIAQVHLPPAAGLPAEGTPCVVAGWGLLNESDDEYTNALHSLQIPVLNRMRCAQQYESDLMSNTSNTFCAGSFEDGKGFCRGDSGGPLVNGNTGMQIGIVSWSDGCGRAFTAGVYTSVSAFRSFIADESGI
ncbi:hypothetical protein NLG97_g1745 [Lecanicillium saksenae]|uniref:Uncharacterized protein n=1 Tax=Lecanicillium saksenae TaxID=468837 RepID=A0ACC1R3K1_9HYPO|nr:hypothetical protein NLG97_g1745 [Lecanicillium saksenae]